MSELVKEKAVVEDEELTELWDEMMQVVEDPTSPPDPEEMSHFVTDLFRKLSQRPRHKFVSREMAEEVIKDLPEVVTQSFKDLGLWDRLPDAGFAPEAIDELKLWTEEEARAFDEDPNTWPSLDEEEEIRREELKIRAVQKLDDFLRKYPTDPAEVLNIMVAGKMAMEADQNPLNLENRKVDGVDDGVPDVEALVDVEEIEACLQALEEGEAAPPPDPTQETVIPPEPLDVFLKRMELMRDFYWDPDRKPSDRKLSREEFKAVQKRWNEFMPDKEPFHYEEIKHVRRPPDWPEWMEKHFRSMQHIVYIIRAAHINTKLTEPMRRLQKYNRISEDVKFRDPAIEAAGFEQCLAHMAKMEKAGFTTEPSLLFGECIPPEKHDLKDHQSENPWSYNIVVDQHLNLLIPEWYHAKLDKVEEQLSEEDLLQDEDEFFDKEKYDFMHSMEKIMNKKEKTEKPNPKKKKKQKQQEVRREPKRDEKMEQRLDELKIGIKDGDPKLYDPVYLPKEQPPPPPKNQGSKKGDYWYEGPLCEAWKDGYYITVNCTVIYKLDIRAGKVSDIEMRWGGIMGSLLEAEDAERIYCEAVGVEYESRRHQHPFSVDWREFEYKPIRRDPVEWFKTKVLGIN